MRALKDRLKRSLPAPLLKLLMGVFFYVERLRHWGLVLIQLRGADPSSTLKLWLSALASPVTALGRFDRWENPKLLFDADVVAPGVGRFHCRARMDDLFHVLPSAQAAVHRMLKEHLRPGMTFIDAGANIGFFSVLGAKLVGPQGRVIAIEMMPDTAAILRKHLADNDLGYVQVVENALWNRIGDEIIAHTPRFHAGQASVVVDDFSGDAMIEHRVLTTTLDEVARDLPKIDFMKVDLEGAEATAFDGAGEMLKRTTALVFESWPGDPKSEASVERMRAAGFELQTLDGYNTLAFKP